MSLMIYSMCPTCGFKGEVEEGSACPRCHMRGLKPTSKLNIPKREDILREEEKEDDIL